MESDLSAILVTPYHVSKSENRNREYRICLRKNLENPLIKAVILMSSERIIDPDLVFNPKVRIFHTRSRPTYWDAFETGEKHRKRIFNRSDSILIVCNSDIYVSEESVKQMSHRLDKRSCLALSRWNAFLTDDLTVDYELYDHCDSQDTWVFLNTVKRGKYKIEMGIPGCDNRLAKELTRAGYEVKNPARSIVTNHLHISEVRTYTPFSKRIRGPYLQIELTE